MTEKNDIKDIRDTIWGTRTFYDKWVEGQGIPIITGYSVEDLNKVTLKPWERKGGRGAFIMLQGTDNIDDAYVCEIPPGESLKPQRHLFEEMIYILSGTGATTLWWNDKQKQTFEWQTGSYFSPPLNVWHQHFNGNGEIPVRFMAVTGAPLMLNLIHNYDFIFNNEFPFTDRYSGEADYFSDSNAKLHPGRIWESNFIRDVRSHKLYEWKERGAGGTNAHLELSNNTMAAHISEFPVGTYKKAHRHGPASHVMLVSGEGYTLMWPEGQPRIKVPWHAGSMFVPPNLWFHQHFNTGSTPARYLAQKWTSRKHSMGQGYRTSEDVKTGGDQIEYADQNPEIEKEFQAELSKNNLTSQMAPLFKK